MSRLGLIFGSIESSYAGRYGIIAHTIYNLIPYFLAREATMKIETRELKSVSVVKVSGRVDSSTAPDLDTTLKDHINTDRYNLVVDLQETDYMSSAGLRALVAALKEAKKHGGNVRIAQPSARVQEVIDLAGLTPVFDIHPDVVEAVGAF